MPRERTDAAEAAGRGKPGSAAEDHRRLRRAVVFVRSPTFLRVREAGSHCVSWQDLEGSARSESAANNNHGYCFDVDR